MRMRHWSFWAAAMLFLLPAASSAPYVPGSADISLSGAPIYKVGRREAFDLQFDGNFVDPSDWQTVRSGSATIRTTIFYPASPSEGATSSNVDFKTLLPELFVALLGAESDLSIPTLSFKDAPLRAPEAGKRYPVVSWLHGDTSSYMTSISIIESIASRGFIVLASDAPCNNLIQLLTSQLDSDYQAPSACPSILEAADFVRAQLKTSDSTLFTGLAEAAMQDHYALIGHSRGGLYAMQSGARGGAVQLTVELMISHLVFREVCAGEANVTAGCNRHNAYESGPVSATNYVSVLSDADPRYSTKDAAGWTASNISTPAGFKWTISLPGTLHESPAADFCHVIWKNSGLLETLDSIATTFGAAELLLVFTGACGDGTDSAKAAFQSMMSNMRQAILASLVRAFGDATACAKTTMQDLNSAAIQDLPNAGNFFLDATPGQVTGNVEECSFAGQPEGPEPVSSASTSLWISFRPWCLTMGTVMMAVTALT